MQKYPVQYLKIAAEKAGQRIDNFLITYLKGLPKTRIYRLLRKGEIRVNKKRIKPDYRLQNEDEIRLPPLELGVKVVTTPSAQLMTLLASRILYEDQQVLVINKPSGIPVHGGNAVKLGMIEALRCMYPKLPELELVHRLDKETSGCLIIAKKRSALRKCHALLREGQIKKIYWALTKGHWQTSELTVTAHLQKNQLSSGERIVRVQSDGKASLTEFRPLKVYQKATLVEALLKTGRTHQIRVHAQYAQHPVAGDEKYGQRDFNLLMQKLGLKRLFLHAYSLEWRLSPEEPLIQVVASLDPDLASLLKALE